ncbi:MAG: hypothetical protein A2096_11345 [Spirochaetes bacterium GWF1_41_5]|nr:MAG: hypothetical protein A2096_11345 [Spirochaetes bacterium GWF1_41_5]
MFFRSMTGFIKRKTGVMVSEFQYIPACAFCRPGYNRNLKTSRGKYIRQHFIKNIPGCKGDNYFFHRIDMGIVITQQNIG